MPAKFFWFLPTSGDSRSIVASSHASSNQVLPPNYRPPTRRYLGEVARAADRLGYEGVLTPTGTWCEDAWLTTAALLAETERLKFLVAFRPGLVPPTLAAQQAATLQRFSDGRVLLNIVTGGDDVEQRRFGDWLDHDERYARTGEFLHIVDSVWRQDRVDYTGKYFHVEDARVSTPPDPLPQIYFGGSSPAALPIAAQYVDVYLTWGEPPQAAAAKIGLVRELAQARGREIRFGIRLHTISRDTSAAAWAVADELVAGLGEDQIAKQTALHASSQSEGQRRMTALHGGRLDALEIYPNLWAGVGLVRGGAGTALVGSQRGGRQPDLRVLLTGLRRVHPLGLSPPRRGLLVRRGSPPAAEAEGRCLSPSPRTQQLNRMPMSAGGATFARQPNGAIPAADNRIAV